jgi:hypothetical protein
MVSPVSPKHREEERALRKRRGPHPKKIAWVLLSLTAAFALAGIVLGSSTLVIIAVLIPVLTLVYALAIPRYVQDLGVPPGMPNAQDEEHQQWDRPFWS